MSRHALLTVPYGNGGVIALDERDWLQREILTQGFYEPEVWDALFEFASRSEVLWDIGAHVGTFTIRSLLDPRVACVHAFEPDPESNASLKQNVTLNAHRGKPCVIHQLALTDGKGHRELFCGPPANRGLASLTTHPTRRAVRVTCESIDRLIFGQMVEPPTLMKIDVEGAEMQALNGALRLLKETPPRAIAFEAAADLTGRLVDDGVAHILGEADYTIRHIRRPNGVVDTRENFLAVAGHA